jgi:hypothetical protein
MFTVITITSSFFRFKLLLIFIMSKEVYYPLLRRRANWAKRLIAEYRLNPGDTWFCTITYDDEHLPVSFDDDDLPQVDVSKRDVQLWFKRFRENYGDRLGHIRYFIVSEFGENTLRPHYHAIIFTENKCTTELLNEAILNTWNNGYIIDVSRVRGDGALRYVANYILSPTQELRTLCLMSRHPDLMYGGSGNMYQSQMPGAASGSAPNVDYGSFSDNLRFAMQAQVMDAQVSKIEMENKLLAEQALSQASLRELQSGQAADALARAEHQKIYNRHADTRYFLENETRGLKNTLLGADVNSYETRLRLDQQRVANDNMRAKVQVLQLGLNEKKLKADMEKIRAEVSEIMSRTKVNDVQQRKILADSIETEILNKYYQDNGIVPSQSWTGKLLDLVPGVIRALR